jgi:oligopeptidase B
LEEISVMPPVARRIPHPHHLHGDVRPDDFYWLRDRNNPEVIAYLEAENTYADAAMKPLMPLVDRLYEELLARIEQDRVDVPVPHGGYFYYSRIAEGQQYPVYARKRAESRADLDAADEEVLLDLNVLAGDGPFYSVTMVEPSPDHTKLAWLENRTGTDRYTLRVKDLRDGRTLADTLTDVFLYESLAWDSTGRYLFYVTVDASQRPYRLWRHRLAGDEPDILIYEESDPTYALRLTTSASGRYLFLSSENKAADEVRWLPADRPEDPWTVFRRRIPGIKYTLEDWGSDLLVLTNDGAANFRVWHCPWTTPAWERATPLWPEDHDSPVYVQAIHPFRDALLVAGREEGLAQLWVYRDGKARRLPWDEPVYTVRLGENRRYDSGVALITYQSLVTPRITYELDLETLHLIALKQDRVPGGYDPASFRQEQIWATAPDGQRVPISLVYRRDALDHGPAPLLLYGYGSYGATSDPTFVPARLPLLERGGVFAIAHVRGGSEMGYGWYLDGKLLNKRKTFTDFVACAEELIRRGYTRPDRLAAEGRSAGGLLMGAVMNLAPHLFQVVLAGVPFVDVVTTMLDPTIPLTSLEWDEWGNPADAEYYWYIKSYSPYDNVEAKSYPHCLVTTGLNDPRVGYWEPAKWVARLRAEKTDGHTLLLRTHMGAGHMGSSGRYDHLRERALELAFVLDKIGLGESSR